MSDEHDSQRTIEPSERWITECKKRGIFVRSREFESVTVLALMSAVGIFFSREIWASGLGIMSKALDGVWRESTVQSLVVLSVGYGSAMMWPLVLLLGALWLVSVAAALSQMGWCIRPLRMDFGRLNVVTGLGRMMEPSRLGVDLIRVLLKVGWVFGVLLALWWGGAGLVPVLPAVPLESGVWAIGVLITKAVGWSLGLLGLLAVCDLAWEYRSVQKRRRMTPAEAREDRRASEGDPRVKRVIRDTHRRKTGSGEGFGR